MSINMRKVLDAVEAGWQNAPDIAEEVGIHKAKVSVYLGRLVELGLIRRTHREWGRFSDRGRAFHRYAPIGRD